MFKLTYCWKCEEIKEQHKTLNKMLPENICNMLGDYEKCKNCHGCIYFNDHYKEPYEENKDHYMARITIHFLLMKVLDNNTMKPRLTTHDYKYIIQNSQHPLKKTDVEFFSLP